MFTKAFIIVSFCVAASLQDWIRDIRPCGPGIPTPKDFFLHECKEYPCPFYLGFNVTAALEFYAPCDITAMTVKVRFSKWGFFMPWILPNSDGCIHPGSNVSHCPHPQGEKVTHMTSMPVPYMLLKSGDYFDITIEYSLYDQNNNVLCCLRAPAQVLNRPTEDYINNGV
ncbi:NPC intracellular cholesterol transporter 2-like isoform X2 [Microplitis mediator]|uniref:NPC intracellular cholesterol transporter 2-like isoform X2 n=1 Tax=Microplitis mediator TaxID=375433 RepID=UPI00255571B4|nr:NPC intracellular cholesterol transporter 2-like isoform X2 [Microplitis mediator]XP_057321137.1 NPC intracellular cholesterol transporter 2-like isoform X2 [Microplitis mediator]XP_057321138.1 NPC intracellular cholesterol transporter 2-like isoform X2 [Microplitis mediator]